jgi:hypothetical protein
LERLRPGFRSVNSLQAGHSADLRQNAASQHFLDLARRYHEQAAHCDLCRDATAKGIEAGTGDHKSGGGVVKTSVIGGAMLPHAPQFFTMPETEDRATVERVRMAAAEIGARLKAMAPDLWVIFANDHAEQFFHQAAPPFTTVTR